MTNKEKIDLVGVTECEALNTRIYGKVFDLLRERVQERGEVTIVQVEQIMIPLPPVAFRIQSGREEGQLSFYGHTGERFAGEALVRKGAKGMEFGVGGRFGGVKWVEGVDDWWEQGNLPDSVREVNGFFLYMGVTKAEFESDLMGQGPENDLIKGFNEAGTLEEMVRFINTRYCEDTCEADCTGCVDSYYQVTDI